MIQNNQGLICKAFIDLCKWVVKRDNSGKNDPVYRPSVFSMRLDSSSKVVKFFRSQWNMNRFNDQEQVYVIFADRRLRPIFTHCINTGDICETIVDFRTILKFIILYKASSIYIAHNHPFGEIEDLEKDVECTETLRDLCRAVKVTLEDHLIITKNSHFSFKEEGLID